MLKKSFANTKEEEAAVQSLRGQVASTGTNGSTEEPRPKKRGSPKKKAVPDANLAESPTEGAAFAACETRAPTPRGSAQVEQEKQPLPKMPRAKARAAQQNEQVAYYEAEQPNMRGVEDLAAERSMSMAKGEAGGNAALEVNGKSPKRGRPKSRPVPPCPEDESSLGRDAADHPEDLKELVGERVDKSHKCDGSVDEAVLAGAKTRPKAKGRGRLKGKGKGKHPKAVKVENGDISASWKIGEAVETLSENGHWYAATIEEVNEDGTYTLIGADVDCADVDMDGKIRCTAADKLRPIQLSGDPPLPPPGRAPSKQCSVAWDWNSPCSESPTPQVPCTPSVVYMLRPSHEAFPGDVKDVLEDDEAEESEGFVEVASLFMSL